MAYSAYQSAPVTQQAVVSVNAGYDRHFCNYRKQLDDKRKHADFVTQDDSCFTIQQRELVFRLNPRFDGLISRPKANGINDISLKVFSSVNNFPSHTEIERFSSPLMHNFQQMHILRSAITFVGVAVQPIFYENTNSKDTVAVQVAGSHTIWNTGDKIIKPGQLVVWDIPKPKNLQPAGKKQRMIPGEPLDKKLFATLPIESVFEDTDGTKLYDFLEYVDKVHLKDSPTTAEGNAMDAAVRANDHKAYNKILLTLYEEIRSRIIGVALSGANPGEQFDILIGSHH